ncbi:9217_t:CDS:2 [Rhizophagus irregularis]|nr:9217_t:CDS:2 [Rhizophagus irregularis]
MLKRNKFRIEERVSFGLFLNENRPIIMILFYICFITIFLPQFTFAQQPLTLNTESDLKVIQSTSYLDGTILLRLTKQEPNINCNVQNLWFNVIEPDGTSKSLNVEKHSIPADNFCSISKSTLTKRHQTFSMSANIHLVKRHPECDGAKATTFECCSKYPDKCKDPKSAENSCSQNPNLEGCKDICEKAGGCKAVPKSPCDDNPYGPGCKVDCGSANPPPGCANVPNCGKTPGADGCDNGKLNCQTYPTSPECDCGKNPSAAGCANLPNCAGATAKTVGCNGKKFDCTIYPRAPECIPNCASNPFLPGCNDCTYNKNASGCDVCNQNPQAARCLTGFCTSYPDVPECSLLMTDKIKIHAITEGFILVTYLCNPSSNGDTCGSVIDWKGFERSTVTFESSCNDGQIVENSYGKGFLYMCNKYASKEVFGVIYGSPDRNGAVSVISSKTITTVETFNTELVNGFSTEDGGYCVTTSNGGSVFTTFIQKDYSQSVRGPFTIYQDNTATSIQILVCNIAYQSSGYSCVIQTTNNANQATYTEIDFLSNGNATTTVLDLSSYTNNKVITDIKPLNYGGYAIFTTDRTSGDVITYIIDNKGNYGGTWDLPLGFYTSGIVLPNNTIVAIPKDASNVGTNENNGGAITIESSDSFTSFSSIEGGTSKSPGGPGGYGSSKISNTTPSKGAEISLDTASEQKFTILYTVPIASSTGNVSVYQVNGNSVVLKQSVSSTNGEFVTFENGTAVTFSVLYGAIDAFNAPYYVQVDNDFVKEQSNGQNVIGIRPQIWNFTTKDESAIIRLSTEGTSYYTKLSSKDREAFADTMSDELASAISCERTRLSTVGYQYDGHTKEDQVIMRVDIKKTTEANQVSSEKLVQDLDDDVKNRGINSLANGNSASLLDASNGAPRTEKLWRKYWGFLLAALLLFLILTLLFIFARLRCKKGANNFLPIFLSALIPIDIAFDIAFMSLHGRDFKWVLPTTVLFFVLPIVLNFMLTRNLIKRENARNRKEFNNWWKNHRGIANTFKTASYLDTDALQVVSSGVGGVESLSAPVSEEGRKSILFATGAVVFFEDLPQLIIYSVYIGSHVKPAIVPILVLSSCLMVIVLKSISILCSSCCYGKGPTGSQGEKPLDAISTSSSSSDDDSSDEKDDGFAPDANKTTTTHNLPRTQDGPQDGGPQDGEPHDRDNPNTFGNIPTGKDKPKPADSTSEKPTKPSPTDKDDSKSPKKPGLPGILNFGKKPKDPTVLSDVGKPDKKTKETEVTEEIKEPIETTEEKETTGTKTKPRNNIDSTIRDSTVENYDNARKYLEATKKDDDDTPNTSTGGGGGYSYGAGIPVYYGLGPAPKNNNKTDKINIATGAAISGVTAADGPTVRYSIIYLDDDKEKDKPVDTIKTTTTKTSTPDGDKHITKTDTGKEYITIYIDGKYITKIGNEEYVTRATNDEEYITKINGKSQVDYIVITSSPSTTVEEIENITEIQTTIETMIETDENGIITETVTERTPDGNGINGITTVKVTTTKKDPSGKVIDTDTRTYTEKTSDVKTGSSTRNIEIQTTIETMIETDENGIVTETVTERTPDGNGINGITTVKVITTKKDPSGKVIDTNTETYTEKTSDVKTGSSTRQIEIQTTIETMTDTDKNGIVTETVTERTPDGNGINGITTVKVIITKKDPNGKVIDTDTKTYTEKTRDVKTGSSKTQKGKQVNTETSTETDENGIVTVTVTETETDENGNTITKVTTTKKDSSGKVLETNTETMYGVTEFVTEPEETYITGDETTTRTVSYNNDPRRKQTRTFTKNETDEHGIMTVTTTTEVIEDDGSTTTTVVTTKKDQKGNELESNTQTSRSNPGETIVTTSGDAKTSSSKTPKRKQTRTNTMSQTDVNGIVTETTTEIETDENGKTITKVTTTKKDTKGNVIESNTETKESFTEPEVTKTSSKVSSIIGPSIYQQGLEKLKKEKK